MRALSLVAVVWSLLGMPTLCRAGILVECCTSEIPAHEKPHDAPDECCPNKCPDDNPEKRPDDTESSEPRDCDFCAESCNVVSPHSKQTGDDGVVLMLVSVITVTQAPRDALLPYQHRPRNLDAAPPGEHLPFPVSDRPLLI